MPIPVDWINNGATYYAPINWDYNQPVINDGDKNIKTSLGSAVVFDDINLRICSFEYSNSLNVSKDQPYVESGKALYAVLQEESSDSVILETDYYRSVNSSIYLTNQTTLALANQQDSIFEEYGEGITLTPHADGNHRIILSWVWSIDVSDDSAVFKLCKTTNGGAKEDIRISKYVNTETGGTGEVVDVIEGGSIVGSTESGTDTKIPESIIVNVDLSKSESYTFTLEFCGEASDSDVTIYSYDMSIEYKPLRY